MSAPPRPRVEDHSIRLVVAGLARGRERDEIAADLDLTRWQVKFRMLRAARHFDIPVDQAAIVHLAYKHGWLAQLSAEERSPVELPKREQQVLVGMALGQTNAEIGKHLGLSEDTVRTYGRRLFQKLGARTRAHAVALGHQHHCLTTSGQAVPRPEPYPERITYRYGTTVHAWDGQRTPCNRRPDATVGQQHTDTAEITCPECRTRLRLTPLVQGAAA